VFRIHDGAHVLGSFCFFYLRAFLDEHVDVFFRRVAVGVQHGEPRRKELDSMQPHKLEHPLHLRAEPKTLADEAAAA
jgi:hypothetical protein